MGTRLWSCMSFPFLFPSLLFVPPTPAHLPSLPFTSSSPVVPEPPPPPQPARKVPPAGTVTPTTPTTRTTFLKTPGEREEELRLVRERTRTRRRRRSHRGSLIISSRVDWGLRKGMGRGGGRGWEEGQMGRKEDGRGRGKRRTGTFLLN